MEVARHSALGTRHYVDFMAQSALPEEAAAFLRECVGDAWSAEPLAGDASVRRYFRVKLKDGSTQMLAYYPREVRAQLRQFLVDEHGVLLRKLDTS